MRVLDKLFNKKDVLGVFAYQKHIYAAINHQSKTSFAVSRNGLDFVFRTRIKSATLKQQWQKILKRRIVEYHLFNHHLAPGSERLHHLNIEGVVREPEQVLVFFNHQPKPGQVETGVIALDPQNIDHLLWRGTEPVWQSPKSWQNKNITHLGLVKIKNKILSYWKIKGRGLVAVSHPHFRIDQQISIQKAWLIHKHENNPLISPNPDHPWESFTTFNPAATVLAGNVHLLYRAQGHDYRSVLGYALSQDGINIDLTLDQPAYLPRKPFEKKDPDLPPSTKYFSGGGTEGCEDPRITRIGNRLYMTYVAFNCVNPPRIALTSIKITDFLNHRWLWEKPVLISPPGIVDKSACILPKKINNKYVIFHRIFPDILVDYVDSLDFSPGQYLQGQYHIKPRGPMWWDSRKIGVGSPPLLTKDGWLLIYQTVDDKNANHYKIGAMILKADEPHVELYRSRYPIMEPDQWYDNHGFKAGVVYPCGAVIRKNQLFVYYGGADSHVCVATANLDQFLDRLKQGRDTKLESTILAVSSK